MSSSKGGFKQFSREFQQYCVQSERLIKRVINFDSGCDEEKLKYEIENTKLTKILEYLYLGKSKSLFSFLNKFFKIKQEMNVMLKMKSFC